MMLTLISTLDLVASILVVVSPWSSWKIEHDNGHEDLYLKHNVTYNTYTLYDLRSHYLSVQGEDYSAYWATIFSLVFVSLACATVGFSSILGLEVGGEMGKSLWKKVTVVVYWLQFISVIVAGSILASFASDYEKHYEASSESETFTVDVSVYYAGPIILWIVLPHSLAIASYITWLMVSS